MRISRYASLHGYRQSVRHFANEFPQLNESSNRRWTSTYKSQMVQQQTEEKIIIGLKRGRSTLLSSEFDAKLRTMIQNIGIGCTHKYTVRGVLGGLVRSDVEKYGHYLDFHVTRPWVRSLYHRMKKSHKIPDELILNLDQTSSKFVAASNVTMAEKGSKHVSIVGGTDKRCIILTVIESMSGQLLPLQVIYKRKSESCLPPNVRAGKRFLFSYKEKHCSNNKETLLLIRGILLPYRR